MGGLRPPSAALTIGPCHRAIVPSCHRAIVPWHPERHWDASTSLAGCSDSGMDACHSCIWEYMKINNGSEWENKMIVE
jgi:hypothetical protein